jgi:hypothetical protein
MAIAALLVLAPLTLGVVYLTGSQKAVEADSRARELVMLGGNPGPVSRVGRLRVVVADLGLASQSRPDAPRWLDRDSYADAVHTLGREVAVSRADVVVLYDVLFDGYRASGIPTAERIAVEAELPWRVEVNLWNRRFAMHPLFKPSEWAREVVGGVVVLSRFPIVRHTVETFPPAPSDMAWAPHRGLVRLVIQTGPDQEHVLEVVDRGEAGEPTGGDGLGSLHVRRMDGLQNGIEPNRVATDGLELVWGGPATAVLAQNRTRFHDNLRDPVILVELSVPAGAEPTEAEDPNPTDP